MATSFLQHLHPVVPHHGPSALLAAMPSRGRHHFSVAREPHSALRARISQEGC